MHVDVQQVAKEGIDAGSTAPPTDMVSQEDHNQMNGIQAETNHNFEPESATKESAVRSIANLEKSVAESDTVQDDSMITSQS